MNEKITFLNKIPQYQQRSAEWFNQRKNKLTSSDIATVLGLNPYKKKYELFFEKCGIKKKYEGNEATLHGQKYEDEAIEKYNFLMGKKTHSYGMISYNDLDSVRKDKLDFDLEFLGGSPDGVAEDLKNREELILLEVKCPLRRQIRHGEIPVYYYPQVQFNMLIMDFRKADFIEYVPKYSNKNMEMNIVRIQRNDAWLNESIPVLIDFWLDVQKWRNKDLNGHPDYLAFKKTIKEEEEEKPKSKKLFIHDIQETQNTEDDEEVKMKDEGCLFDD